jgi:hypothetical protein
LTVYNALDPYLMTAAERVAEIGEILAAGLIRVRARQRGAERSLDFTADYSVPAIFSTTFSNCPLKTSHVRGLPPLKEQKVQKLA